MDGTRFRSDHFGTVNMCPKLKHCGKSDRSFMAQGATDKLYDYWKSKLDGDRIPDRRDMVMSEMTSIIPQVMILERSAQGATFRLAGSDICTTHRSELKGTALRSMFAHLERHALDTVVHKVFDREAGFRIATRLKSEWGYADFDTVLLPLRNGSEGIVRMVAAQCPKTTPASLWWRGSYNVGLHSILEIDELTWRCSSTVVRDPRLQPPAHEVPVLELARRGRVPEGRKVGHLTVIEGGVHC
jgi:hypothetical protein